MSLNWREIALIVGELPLENSLLQAVVQHTFNSLSWEFYHRQVGRWTLYTEIGTPHARLHMLTGPKRQKTEKLQRFVQFARARLIGSRVTAVYQYPFDRLVRLTLARAGATLYLYIRLYSGSGANIIVTDSDNQILDLLLRRPRRGEVSGNTLELGALRTEEGKPFAVRARDEHSFNRQIEREYGQESESADLAKLLESLDLRRERELGRLVASLESQRRTQEKAQDFERLKTEADLLSANSHLIKDGMDEITLHDWSQDCMVTLTLDPRLGPRGQVQAAYDRYSRSKGAWENATEEIARIKTLIDEREEHYRQLAQARSDESAWIVALQREVGTQQQVQQGPKGPGLRITSGDHTILVGRNAKENDELLRRHTRGNDWWMHTRDHGGGYVFIKDIRGKSVPLNVLLDAATLAIHYSKARKEGKAELYYTQVKYLRRAKGGKTGLVLPTQEKNLSVVLDEERLRRLLLEHEDA